MTRYDEATASSCLNVATGLSVHPRHRNVVRLSHARFLLACVLTVFGDGYCKITLLKLASLFKVVLF